MGLKGRKSGCVSIVYRGVINSVDEVSIDTYLRYNFSVEEPYKTPDECKHVSKGKPGRTGGGHFTANKYFTRDVPLQ